MKFEVSVIIPVYNAERFLLRAVESALQFTYVKEVLLIEDGSTDNSLEVCREIYKNYPTRVKLLQHTNGANKGAGETRNLGLMHAQSDYISFLDADDYYLENRFETDIRIFEKYPDADGAYNALGSTYEDFNLRSNFLQQGLPDITSVSHNVPPGELKQVLLGLHSTIRGYFSLDTLTLKKSSLNGLPMFTPILRLHQDTEWMVKLSFLLKLYSSEIKEPVAMRNVHSENRVTRFTSHQSRVLFYKTLLDWLSTLDVDRKYKRIIKYRYFNHLLSAEESRYKRLIRGFTLVWDKEVISNIKFLKLIAHRILIMNK